MSWGRPPFSATRIAAKATVAANNVAQKLQYNKENNQVKQAGPQAAATAAAVAAAAITTKVKHVSSLLFSLSVFDHNQQPLPLSQGRLAFSAGGFLRGLLVILVHDMLRHAFCDKEGFCILQS